MKKLFILFISLLAGLGYVNAHHVTNGNEFSGPIIITGSVTDVACPGASTGAISITVTGGTGVYTYAWTGPNLFTSSSQNISGVPAGNYMVTVTDNGSGIATKSFTINEIPDNSPPTLNNVPANATVECDAVPSGSAPVTASDNCSATLKYFRSPTIKTKPAHRWAGDNNFNDAGGIANGTPVGAVGFGPGISGSCFSFSNASNASGYINTGTAGSIAGTGNFSVGAWVKTTGTGPMVVIQERQGPSSLFAGADGEYILKIGGNHNSATLTPGKAYFLVYGGPDYANTELYSTSNVNDGKWHRIAGERSGSTVTLFVDGVAEATGSTGTPVILNPAGTLATYIGRDVRDNNSQYVGLIDDISVTSSPSCSSNYEFDRVWIATDGSGNQTAASQHVTVRDTKAPILACPQNITVNNAPGQCGANVSYTATATDNCSTPVITYSIPSGSFFIVGTTTVTVTAKDDCGNVSTCNFTVTVNDNEKPKANCKNASVTLVNGTANVTPTDVNNNSTDNCGIKSMSVSPSIFTCANIGNNTVTLTVIDIHDNVQSCQSVVTVVGAATTCHITAIPSNNVYTGGIPTNIYLGYGPQSVTLNATATGGAPFTYSWIGTGTLSCNNCASPVFTPTSPGTYNFTATVTNSFGCKSTCTISICVTDIRDGREGKKVFVCHRDPNHPDHAHTESVEINHVPEHIPGHPLDKLGKCDQVPCTTPAPDPIVVNDDRPVGFNISVLPNPNKGMFTVSLGNMKDSKAEVAILDAYGATIEKKIVGSTAKQNIVVFNLSSRAPGMYFVKVITADGVRSEKIVIER